MPDSPPDIPREYTPQAETEGPLLRVCNLTKHFELREPGLFGRVTGTVQAVTDVSFEIHRGETFAIVGESGCGKSTLAKTIATIYPADFGEVWFSGNRLADISTGDLKSTRRRVQMIFQDPFGSLNPRMTAAEIIAEPLVIHAMGDKVEQRQRTREVAEAVGLDTGDLNRYPHQFSGGQRQRIAIARAIAPKPKLVIADEPLSALDVSIQSQILNLMVALQHRENLTYFFISHDLAAVRHVAGRVAVMYLGRIVEMADTEALFADARHPYTQALIAALPEIGHGKKRRAAAPAGDVPSPLAPPPGCPFHPRCPKAQDLCRVERPELATVKKARKGHLAACHFSDPEKPQE